MSAADISKLSTEDSLETITSSLHGQSMSIDQAVTLYKNTLNAGVSVTSHAIKASEEETSKALQAFGKLQNVLKSTSVSANKNAGPLGRGGLTASLEIIDTKAIMWPIGVPEVLRMYHSADLRNDEDVDIYIRSRIAADYAVIGEKDKAVEVYAACIEKLLFHALFWFAEGYEGTTTEIFQHCDKSQPCTPSAAIVIAWHHYWLRCMKGIYHPAPAPPPSAGDNETVRIIIRNINLLHSHIQSKQALPEPFSADPAKNWRHNYITIINECFRLKFGNESSVAQDFKKVVTSSLAKFPASAVKEKVTVLFWIFSCSQNPVEEFAALDEQEKLHEARYGTKMFDLDCPPDRYRTLILPECRAFVVDFKAYQKWALILSSLRGKNVDPSTLKFSGNVKI